MNQRHTRQRRAMARTASAPATAGPGFLDRLHFRPSRPAWLACVCALALAYASIACAGGAVMHTQDGFIERNGGVIWFIPSDGSAPHVWNGPKSARLRINRIVFDAKHHRLVASGARIYGGGYLATSTDGQRWHTIARPHVSGPHKKLADFLLAKSLATAVFATHEALFTILEVPSWESQSMNPALRANAGKGLVCTIAADPAAWTCSSFIPKLGGRRYARAEADQAYGCGNTLSVTVTNLRATPEGTTYHTSIESTRDGMTWRHVNDPIPGAKWHCVGGKLYAAFRPYGARTKPGRYVYLLTPAGVTKIAHLDITTSGGLSNDITGNGHTLIVYGRPLSLHGPDVAEVSRDGGRHYVKHDLNIPAPTDVAFAGGAYGTRLGRTFMVSKDGVTWRKL